MRSHRHQHHELADRELLRQLVILSVLPDAVLDDLVVQSTFTSYRKGDEVDWLVYGEGVVLGVVEGLLDVSFHSFAAKQLSVLEVPEARFVDLGTDGWAGTDPTTVTVRSARALICSIPHDPFEAAVLECQRAAQLLLREHDRWLRALGGAADDRLHPPGESLRHLLWRDSRDRDKQVVSYTHERLAARIGTTRSIVTTEIGRLVRDQIVEVRRPEHKINILQRDRLAEDQRG
jgi:CRP-like cAMP-binding protein